MERDKIIKALECCTDKNYHCEDCPYFYKSEGIKSSMEILMTDALALIKELTEENEQYRTENMVLSGEIERLKVAGEEYEADAFATIEMLTKDNEWSAKRIIEADKKVAKLTEENERLRAENEMLLNIKNLNLDKVIADTVRKMQNLIAQKIGTYTKESYVYVHAWFKLIDQIAKEMLEVVDDNT